MPLSIDLKFLQEKEGYTHYGTIPRKGDGTIAGKSGVTIGLGIDLGQQNEKSLKEAGMSLETVRILKPYLGLKGVAAEKVLEKIPLVLSPSVTEKLSRGIMADNVEKLILKYDKGSTTPFRSLTPRQQTALYSVTHQYGLSGAPKFLSYAQEGNWKAVRDELWNFGDPQQKSRNESTGAYLDEEDTDREGGGWVRGH